MEPVFPEGVCASFCDLDRGRSWLKAREVSEWQPPTDIWADCETRCEFH